MKPSKPKPVIGWREWVVLDSIADVSVKAKVDTGARTSSLHAFDVEPFRRQGVEMVRFNIHPIQRKTRKTVQAESPLIEHRWVTSSTGRRTHRPVILVPVCLMGHRWEIELTLVNRDAMGFRMLLGRQALRERFVVDPGRSFLGGVGSSR